MTVRSPTVRTSTGQILGDRETQEDYSSILRFGANGSDVGAVLATVCDGMGGHAAGELASRTAAVEFQKSFQSTRAPLSRRLATALEAANAAVGALIAQEPRYKGMGCTLIATYVDSGGVRWVSVGDSSILLYRKRELTRLNADHSYGAFLDQQVREGAISAADARDSPRRRSLRSAITGASIALKDVREEPLALAAGDIVILATDGLEVLTAGEIVRIVEAHVGNGADGLAKALMSAVESHAVPGQDNTTVVVLSIIDPGDSGGVHAPQGAQDDERTQPYVPSAREAVAREKADPDGGRRPLWPWALVIFAIGLALGYIMRSPAPEYVPAPVEAVRPPAVAPTPEAVAPPAPGTDSGTHRADPAPSPDAPAERESDAAEPAAPDEGAAGRPSGQPQPAPPPPRKMHDGATEEMPEKLPWNAETKPGGRPHPFGEGEAPGSSGGWVKETP